MNTAVQLRRVAGDAPPSDLLHGTPGSIISGRLGPVALFSPGAIVVYRIRHRRRTRLFVFRTLEVDDRLAASIPGVHPRVQLLLDVRSHALAVMAAKLRRVGFVKEIRALLEAAAAARAARLGE